VDGVIARAHERHEMRIKISSFHRAVSVVTPVRHEQDSDVSNAVCVAGDSLIRRSLVTRGHVGRCK
jgi:hypothetical protein